MAQQMKTASAIPRKSKKKPRAKIASHEDKSALKRTKGAPPVPSPAGRRGVLIAAACVAAAAALCYANSLGNGFVFDDRGIVLGNPLLRNPAYIPYLLTVSYRPLRDISHAVDFALWGEDPFGFHLTNVLIHIANVLLVFLLIRRFTRQTLTATMAALIFAVHPIQTDAVTYISGRRDVLFALFYLASFHCYLGYRDYASSRKKRSFVYFALFLLLWALSLMTKEMAASLPLLIFVWNFCEDWSQTSAPWWKRSFKAAGSALAKDKWLYIVLAVAAAAYGWYITIVKGGSTLAGAGGFIYWGGSFYTNLLTVLCVHAWYLKQLVFPTPIVQYLGAFDVATTILHWRVILSIIVVAAVLTAAFLLLKRDKLMSFAVLSYFVLLLPVSHIIPHHELLADHYLYLPMMSFGLLVALVVRKIAERGRSYQRAAYAVTAAALIALAVLTVLRNRDWKDDSTLWEANYREAPNSIRAAGNLASLYSTRNPNKAIELYRRCLQLDPSYSSAYLGLASLMQTRDEAQKLEQMILKAMEMPQPEISTPGQQYYRSSRSQLITALALTKHNQGKDDEAQQLLRSVIASDPGDEDPYKILGDMYHEDNPERELEVLRKQIEANPLNLQALNNLTRRLIVENRYDEALPYLAQTISIDPNNFSANCHLGQIYQKKNDCSRARAYLSTARSAAVRPDQGRVINDLDAALDRQCGR